MITSIQFLESILYRNNLHEPSMLLLHALAVSCFPTLTSAVANFRIRWWFISHCLRRQTGKIKTTNNNTNKISFASIFRPFFRFTLLCPLMNFRLPRALNKYFLCHKRQKNVIPLFIYVIAVEKEMVWFSLERPSPWERENCSVVCSCLGNLLEANKNLSF